MEEKQFILEILQELKSINEENQDLSSKIREIEFLIVTKDDLEKLKISDNDLKIEISNLNVSTREYILERRRDMDNLISTLNTKLEGMDNKLDALSIRIDTLEKNYNNFEVSISNTIKIITAASLPIIAALIWLKEYVLPVILKLTSE